MHKSYELYVYVYKCIAIFPKRDRYTLGVKLEQNILELLELLVIAENKTSKSKLLILNKADINLKIIKMLIRMSHELGSLKESKYIESEAKVLEIGRMLGGWIKQIKKAAVMQPL